MDFRCTFFVVTSGKPSFRSKRIWWPKTLRVPVPVRSVLGVPCVCTWRMKSSYCERMGRSAGAVMRASEFSAGLCLTPRKSRLAPAFRSSEGRSGSRLAQEDLDPAVLRPAGVAVVVRDRLALAAAGHFDARRRHAARGQVVAHALRPLDRQR